MRTEKELDYLESFIPGLAESATKKAYLDALSSGRTVTEIVNGELVSTAPDGSRVFIKATKPMVRVTKNV